MRQEESMAEKIVIHIDRGFGMKTWSSDPHAEAAMREVAHLSHLTPYGMLLAGLASCTAIVVLTYAEHHNVDLREVRLSAEYERVFREDCEKCEEPQRFEEQISMGIEFQGKLTPQEREKLFKISLQCPIHKMLKTGIAVRSELEVRKPEP